MSNLETRITEWRAQMSRELPRSPEVVAELEEHLREHVAHLQSHGKPDDEAFALAQARVGEPRAIGREFHRIPGGWRPGLIALPIVGILLAFNIGWSLWHMSQRSTITLLYVATVGSFGLAYFGILGAGIVACSAFLKAWWRPLNERDRGAVRRCLSKLAVFAGVFLTLFWGLVWWPPSAMTHEAVWRLVAGIISLALLISMNARSAMNDRMRWLAGIFPFLILFSAGVPPFVRVADIPVRWVCVLLLLAQAYLALPPFRIRIERLRETS